MNKILLLPALMMVSSLLFAQTNDSNAAMDAEPVIITGVINGAPPSDAIVLFDGRDMDAWETAETEAEVQWDVANGAVTVGRGNGTIKTKQVFGDLQLHVEFQPTDVIQGSGQGRGNSGIFLHSLFEVQVLDSWDNPTYFNGQAGAVYLQHAPLVNASRKPGEWQSFDIIYQAPVFDVRGELRSPAFLTVLQNGVLIQNHVEIQGATFTPEPEYTSRCQPYAQGKMQDCSGKMPITLQDHGQIVSYRNIWVREL